MSFTPYNPDTAPSNPTPGFTPYGSDAHKQALVTAQNNIPTDKNSDTTNDGFLSSLVKDPIKTLIVKPAIRTSQAIATGVGDLIGNKKLVDAANQGQTFDVPILGKYYIEPQKNLGKGGVSQIVGDSSKAASYLAPIEGAEAAGASLFKGQALKAMAGSSLAGLQYGALSSFGDSLQQDEPTLGKILENTLIGGATGLVGGGLLGLGGAFLTKGVRGTADFANAIKTPEGIYQKLAETNRSILNLTKNQTTAETKFIKDTPLFIAKEAPDVHWNVGKDGRLDTQPVIDALEPKYHSEAQAFNLALKDSGEYASFDSLQNRAVEAAQKQFKGSAQEEAIAKIDREILAYKKQYAPNIINHNGESLVPIHIIDDVKSDLWSKTKFFGTPEAQLQSQTSYLMGNTAKEIIENTVKDAPIKAWNRRLGDFASAIKILNQRNGIKVGAGSYSKTGARILGGVAGHTLGGVPGEIAGMVTADQLLKIASDPNVKSYVFKKLLQKMEANGQTGIIEEVQKVMEQRALERGSRKILPAPRTPEVMTPNGVIPGPGNTMPIPMNQFKGSTAPLKQIPEDIGASQKAAGLYKEPKLLRERANPINL